MMARALIPTLSTIAMAALLPFAAADENGKQPPFALEFRTGAEYDSNVAVLELDNATGVGDMAALLDFHVGFDRQRPKGFGFDVAYDFSQSLYRQLDAYDLRVHRGSAGAGYDFGPVETGVSCQYVDGALAGGEHLTLAQLSPHVGSLIGKRLYVRLAWDRTEKAFAESPERDATTDAPYLDTFVFVDGIASYVVLGYQHVKENAAEDALDYEGSKLKAQLTQRFDLGARSSTLKAGLRYESRAYRAPMLPTTPRREDARYRLELELESALTRHVFVRARYEHAHNRSTERSLDFNENVASVGLGARL